MFLEQSPSNFCSTQQSGGNPSAHAELPHQVASTRAVRAKPYRRIAHASCCDGKPLSQLHEVLPVPLFEDPFLERPTLKIHPSFPDLVSRKK